MLSCPARSTGKSSGEMNSDETRGIVEYTNPPLYLAPFDSNWWPLFVGTTNCRKVTTIYHYEWSEHTYWTLCLQIVGTYVLAPLPNVVFGRLADRQDFMSDYQGGFADAGYFLTGLMVVTGFCLPVVLAHASVVSHHSFELDD